MTIREHLSFAIRQAMKARDTEALSTYRSALAALDNAEAVPTTPQAGALESAALSVGAADVARRELTEAECARVIRTEVLEMTMATKHVGPVDQARLRRQCDLLEQLLHR